MMKILASADPVSSSMTKTRNEMNSVRSDPDDSLSWEEENNILEICYLSLLGDLYGLRKKGDSLLFMHQQDVGA